MTTVARNNTPLLVPPKLQRQAGIKTGDRLKFAVSANTITITVVERPVYKPTAEELAAIRRGEAAIDRGAYATLDEVLHELDRTRRKPREKRARKVSR